MIVSSNNSSVQNRAIFFLFFLKCPKQRIIIMHSKKNIPSPNQPEREYLSSLILIGYLLFLLSITITNTTPKTIIIPTIGRNLTMSFIPDDSDLLL